ncbi:MULTISPECIES: transporter substrate-binding domain-containing protein [Agrobacterium]|uniref:Transporter substrate-binding domain-containing protein n=1 Tax=Agrobacterium rubi TaxID=28099 RepID=A0AAE7RA95_9HYPH|nr:MULTISPECIES: transporter substrate-binding domain-containing protein [Agrobacterium]MBN7807814.1 transporter substrate-binding domain-containing protein [Agrobacterium rosae]NTE89773.1 transporter substrate-binding domain-containing protein [Agrobacterium rubi]NTF05377.1 transporter substrate-binding domain-containing protein [Agrobacterium rubi]NTF39821.1 transporter substrate-binding domain-containing protein [Agrobacterium rubi]OCJ44871.1 amino acid ABC transporter substrate-binding pro
MKAYRTTLFSISILLAGALSVRAETLRFAVAAEPYPPFAMKGADGIWQGFEPELVKRLCERMKATCEIQEVAWDGIIPALLAKRIDVIFASMSITDERENQIAFSKPYYDTPAAVAAMASLDYKLTPEGFQGKVIGVQMSTTSAAYVKQHFDGIAEIRYYDTQDSANADLLSGRIDLIMADATAVKRFTDGAEAKTADIVMKGEVPYDPLFGRGIGAGIRKEDSALKARLDDAITAELGSPDYEASSQFYFGVSVKPNH